MFGGLCLARVFFGNAYEGAGQKDWACNRPSCRKIGLVIGQAALVRFEKEKVKNSGRPSTAEFPQTSN